MLINKDTKIIGQKVILVPYRKEHVLKYHEWMKSQELQELTASSPLSLEEEYEMQQSWQQDSNKCTFIVLSKSRFERNGGDEIDAMIGDTNLFLTDETDPHVAEAEIMIAETEARGIGCGLEAMLLMLHYGIEKLAVREYEVKIGESNAKSVNLFNNKIGFVEVSRSTVFKEITLRKMVDEEFRAWLREQLRYEIVKY